MKYKLEKFIELMQVVEMAFIHKLKTKNPDITEIEIKKAVKDWYLSRPEAPYGDAVGTPGDVSKFIK